MAKKNAFELPITYILGSLTLALYYFSEQGTLLGNISEVLFIPITIVGIFLMSMFSGILFVLTFGLSIFFYGFLIGYILHKLFK